MLRRAALAAAPPLAAVALGLGLLKWLFPDSGPVLLTILAVGLIVAGSAGLWTVIKVALAAV